MRPAFRVGQGYDVHCLVPGRPLILGGVKIAYHQGLAGHSDADVLCHALGDALLGAAGLGDLGRHFPDTDPRYKGISSLRLLETIISLLHQQGLGIENVDATVVAQAPKLAPYIQEMQTVLSKVLNLSAERINIKATTTEGLGFAGRQEGIAAYAVALISKEE
ncbi:MAG: 2-C-methyl-D-erythritol 2,4-cyclodiphosphate synthase [Deltaproteobacteria bacterium]|nr:2-C-methyl-D-erythritol 2,4-cyclodiphosphate synthase [Deltaproteobacteria bacterium]